MKENLTDKLASKHLGKKSLGSEKYDKTLLVKIPRSENRAQYNIDENNLPFLGYDIWHGYEFSTLNQNNIPINRIIKIKYSAKSKYIVESKSLKLYLNSFNMDNFGLGFDECQKICLDKIKKDLSFLLETDVEVNFFDDYKKKRNILKDYKNVFESVDEKELKVEDFKENPSLLEVKENKTKKSHKFWFPSLRSNCRVTHQCDFGDFFLYYKSKKTILISSLIKYLCSFRKEYHFHEECVEMIYKRLYDVLDISSNDGELMTMALYTRRGGIDINPVRYSKNCDIKDCVEILDIKKFTKAKNKQ